MCLKNSDFPKDFEKIIKIFNRLLSNWMYKYNSCVYSRSADIWKEFHDDQGNKYQLYHNDKYKFIKASKLKNNEEK